MTPHVRVEAFISVCSHGPFKFHHTRLYHQVSIGICTGGGFCPFHGRFGGFSGTVTVGAFEPLAFLVSGEPFEITEQFMTQPVR